MNVTEPRNSKHVLLVEDELLVAMHVQTLLEDLGFDDVHWANSIEAAERDLAARTPRFAVLDINVGPKLVFPVAEELQRRAVPFIFSSGSSPELMPAVWARHPFVAKPLVREALANAASVVLARAPHA